MRCNMVEVYHRKVDGADVRLIGWPSFTTSRRSKPTLTSLKRKASHGNSSILMHAT
jgi:hypothetical protein